MYLFAWAGITDTKISNKKQKKYPKTDVSITHSVFKWTATSHPALSLISKKPPPF